MAEKTEGQKEDFEHKKTKKGFFKNTGGYFVNEGSRIVGARNVKEGANFIQGLLATIMEKKTGRNENFFDSVARMNASPQLVLNNYKLFRKTFFIHAACSAICLFAMFYFAFKGNYLSFITGIGALFLFVGNACIFSFRAYQIRKMKLCSFSEWLGRTDVWIPKKLDEAKWLIYWKKLERNRNYQIVEVIN